MKYIVYLSFGCYNADGGMYMHKKTKIWWGITLTVFIIAFLYIVSIRHMAWYYLIPIYLGYFILNYFLFFGTALGITGYVLQAFHKEDAAIKFYRLAIGFHTKSFNALAAYGLILIRQGNPKEALPLFEKILSLKPGTLVEKIAVINQGICYWLMGDLDLAIEILEGMTHRYDYINPDVYTTLGYLYILKKDYETALTYTNKALEDTKTHGPALDNLGQIHYFLGDLEKAEQFFKEALENKGTMVDSKYYLGLIYEQQNKMDLAKEYFEAAYNSNISPLNTVTREEVVEKYNQYCQ